MQPYLLGFFIFAMVCAAKYALVKLVLFKKNIAFWLITTVTLEICTVALIYLFFKAFSYSGEKFIFGFVFGLVTLLLICVISFITKNYKENN